MLNWPRLLQSRMAVFQLTLGLSAGVQTQSIEKFTLEPMGSSKAQLGYFPGKVDLTATKLAGIKKEPAYRATPKYGVIHVGNGPKSAFYFAVDEPKDADWKIYIDKHGNRPYRRRRWRLGEEDSKLWPGSVRREHLHATRILGNSEKETSIDARSPSKLDHNAYIANIAPVG